MDNKCRICRLSDYPVDRQRICPVCLEEQSVGSLTEAHLMALRLGGLDAQYDTEQLDNGRWIWIFR